MLRYNIVRIATLLAMIIFLFNDKAELAVMCIMMLYLINIEEFTESVKLQITKVSSKGEKE